MLGKLNSRPFLSRDRRFLRSAAVFAFMVLLFFGTPGSIPVFAQLTLASGEVDITVEPREVSPGTEAVLRAEYEIPEGMYMALQEDFFYVEAAPPEGIRQGPLTYPEGTEKRGLITYSDRVTLERSLRISPDVSPGDYTLEITAGYQYCDEDGTCFLPQTKRVTVEVIVLEEESTAGGAAEGGADTAGESTSAAGTADGPAGRGDRGILLYLLLALVGGIILNVMPCVLPLLSVRALNLVDQAGREPKKIFVNSLFYTGGILAALLAFALIITLLKVSGELVGWGFQFQNPVFVLVLTSIIFVFALSLFDVFVLQAPGLNAASKATGRGGYAGSFFTGIFAVLIATPCSAPFLGTALGFAFAQTPAVIFLMFFLIGLGFALPFLLLGVYPALIQKLPKPGKWMTVFKEIMGFLLIGTVVYLLNTLFHQLTDNAFYRVLIFLGVLAFTAWLYGRFGNPGRPRASRIIAVLASAFILTLSSIFIVRIDTGTPGNGADREEVYISEKWEVFSPEKLRSYRREGHPVFIDFHAAWCTNCKINRAAVLSTDEIGGAFERYGVKLLHGDFTHNDPVIASWIEKLGRGGVPVYALYVPGREEPVLFPELLTKKIVLDALANNLGND
jgi:thiol:disulfide interchange protein DsbD